MSKSTEFTEDGAELAMSVKSAHVVAAGSVIAAAILLLARVDVVEFAVYMGLTTLALAVIGDVYQRLGRVNLFTAGRR